MTGLMSHPVFVGLTMIIFGLALKAFALQAATSLAKGWTWLYTLGLPAEERERRRREITSDLWEQKSDAQNSGQTADIVAMQTLVRVVVGVPADLLWRYRHKRVLVYDVALLAMSSFMPAVSLALRNPAVYLLAWPIAIGVIMAVTLPFAIRNRWFGQWFVRALLDARMLSGLVVCNLTLVAVGGTYSEVLSFALGALTTLCVCRASDAVEEAVGKHA